ncbi:hypothetical protein GWN28_10175 [candidate division KSB1 bacterium]|nr:hypothetical protein [candidate division KSB1 bacterium]NIU93570.1 hypothetical protein [candidate division KSB1 bacterium]NIW18732.1 hypothetical protein [candidate division KSB1 bacterium]
MAETSVVRALDRRWRGCSRGLQARDGGDCQPVGAERFHRVMTLIFDKISVWR